MLFAIEPLELRVVCSAGSGLPAVNAAHHHEQKTESHHIFVAHLMPISVLPSDRASAVIKVKFIDAGSQAVVSGTLKDISNPSAVVLRLMPPITEVSPNPAKTVTSTTPTNPSGPEVTATVLTTATTLNAQTIAILLKPGTASGPFLHVHFEGTINSSSLIGNLTGKRLGQLRKEMSLGNVGAVVTTNNGVDSAMILAPGNVQSGEIQGTFNAIVTPE
jgi:hypothetical protein